MAKLTEEMVIARSRQSDLENIKRLNCWGNDLADVSIIRRMKGVEVLSLSVNQISTLADFENCQCLQELYLRKNNIQDINEIAYLQSLPNLRNLWLEENPFCVRVGPHYRAIILRALPNLKKLDNIDVTPEEVQDALRASVQREEDVYEDAYEKQPQQQSNQSQQQYQQQSQQQQIKRSQSPVKEQQNQNFENDENLISEQNPTSVPSSPLQRSPPNQDYSPPEAAHPPSPKYNRNHRHSYHQSYDRSPGSDHDSPNGGGGTNNTGTGGISGGYRERGVPPSMSSHSMKEYYQSDYQRQGHQSHYRHSQTDLTEWDEHPHNQSNGHHHSQRRSAGSEREIASGDKYTAYRNGNGLREKEEWEECVADKCRRTDRREGRFSDTASVVSNTFLNHYAGYHRRPVNRSSNLLSATLCLVKELDYPSLEVVEHAVRCRIDELSAE